MMADESNVIEIRLNNLFENFKKDTVALVVGDGFIEVDGISMDLYIKSEILKLAHNRMQEDDYRELEDRCKDVRSLTELLEKCKDHIGYDSDPGLAVTNIVKKIDNQSYDASKLLELLNLGHFNVILSTSVTNKFRHVVEEFANDPSHNLDFFYVELQGDQFSISNERPWTKINRDQMWFVNLMGNNSWGNGNGLSKLLTSEEDMIHFVHSWISATQKAKKFKNYLENCFLLMLGCNVPSWAFRFIWYLIKNPSSKTKPNYNHAVCSGPSDANAEKVFANRFNTTIMDIRETDEFINDIKTRWPHHENYKPRIYKERPGKYRDVFISYASDDIDIVRNRIIPILEELQEEYKISFWYDKEDIKPGKNWRKEIEEGVTTARLFITLQTKHTKEIADDANSERFLKEEWAIAEKCQKLMNARLKTEGSFEYILPVIVGDEENYAEEFKAMCIQHIPLDQCDKLKSTIISRIAENKRFDQIREITYKTQS